jgi:hypothetical protein
MNDAHPGHGGPPADPIDALQLLLANGFGGRKVFDLSKKNAILHYRRTWRGVSDVVLVYAENDAEAYRGDDSINDLDPFEVASYNHLECENVGTVLEVVAAVMRWPKPEAWVSHFPSAAEPPGTGRGDRP